MDNKNKLIDFVDHVSRQIFDEILAQLIESVGHLDCVARMLASSHDATRGLSSVDANERRYALELFTCKWELTSEAFRQVTNMALAEVEVDIQIQAIHLLGINLMGKKNAVICNALANIILSTGNSALANAAYMALGDVSGEFMSVFLPIFGVETDACLVDWVIVSKYL